MFVLTSHTVVRYEGSSDFSVVAVSNSIDSLIEFVPAGASLVSGNRYEMPVTNDEDNDTFIVFVIDGVATV
jgi:hypothetical protein